MPGDGAYTNAFAIAADLDHSGERAITRSHEVTRHYGLLLQAKIQANVYDWAEPQRPMRHTRTGDYRRSWSTNVTTAGAGISAMVGTNKPQARRLEYGFAGPDRLGRVYNDPPRPHAGPAMSMIGPQYTQALADIPEL